MKVLTQVHEDPTTHEVAYKSAARGNHDGDTRRVTRARTTHHSDGSSPASTIKQGVGVSHSTTSRIITPATDT